MDEYDFSTLIESMHQLGDALQARLCAAVEVVREAFNLFIVRMPEQTDVRVITAVQFGEPKELQYILYGRKARTRKKYVNRVLRRVVKHLREAGQ